MYAYYHAFFVCVLLFLLVCAYSACGYLLMHIMLIMTVIHFSMLIICMLIFFDISMCFFMVMIILLLGLLFLAQFLIYLFHG